MAHEYSKFKNKNIPYAKVGRRVFNSLFDAETFCTEHGLDVNSAIEYRDDPELKNNIQTIAQYSRSGEPGVFSNHQEIMLEPFRGWA